MTGWDADVYYSDELRDGLNTKWYPRLKGPAGMKNVGTVRHYETSAPGVLQIPRRIGHPCRPAELTLASVVQLACTSR